MQTRASLTRLGKRRPLEPFRCGLGVENRDPMAPAHPR